MKRFTPLLIAAIWLVLVSTGLAAVPSPRIVGDGEMCAGAVIAAEMQFHLPAKLLGTIALLESGRVDPASGRVVPWPWTINANGAGRVFETKNEAIAAVQELQAAGVHSIDVGCMQINLMYHPNAFTGLDQAFDPQANALYGARFLDALFHQIGNWPAAAAAYHSQTPGIAEGYEQRVMMSWPLASKFPDPGLHRGTPDDGFDYSRYAPQFVAALKQMHADQTHFDAAYAPLPQVAACERHTPEFTARLREMKADDDRLRGISNRHAKSSHCHVSWLGATGPESQMPRLMISARK